VSSTDGGDPPQQLLNIFPVSLAESAGGFALVFVLIFFLLFFGAMFYASRKAYAILHQEDDDISPRVQRLLRDPLKLQAALEITNSLMEVLAITFWFYSFASFFHSNSFWLFLIELLLLVFVLVLTSRLLGVFAVKNPREMGHIMAWPALAALKLFGPIAGIMNASAAYLDKKLHQEKSFEIHEASDVEEAETSTIEEEKNLERSHIRFGARQVRQIMKPRVDMSAIDIEMSYDELMQYVKECGYSRIPVYREDLDSIAGILIVKDLLSHLDQDNGFKWQELVRSPLIVPEVIKIDSLLKEMKRNRVHMAITIDEYGTTSGIVTLEDIMEEVVGEIRDEHDEQNELDYEKVDDRNYVFEGKTLLDDICKALGLKMDIFDDIKGESESLAGLILQIDGKLPEQNEQISYQNFLFTILSLGLNRIEKVKVTILDEE
jgi:gliding motility-associated protein GldE